MPPNTNPKTLGEKQRLFAYLFAQLIVWANENGYEITFGEVERTKAQADANALLGKGISNSLHLIRLAGDINLFLDTSIDGDEDIYQTDSEAYRPLGDKWKSMHPLCRWGGDFKDKNDQPKPDGNHFSLEHEGRK